jgi:hypothetical protein
MWECHGDHVWRGGGICLHCRTRLRCFCGCFIREDGLEEHFKRCRQLERERWAEREKMEAGFA